MSTKMFIKNLTKYFNTVLAHLSTLNLLFAAYLLFAAFEAANFQIDFFGNPVMRTAD